MLDLQGLRPLERRILLLAHEGVDREEIARRFKSSPQHIDRVIAWTKLPGRATSPPDAPRILRPVERRILKMRADGMAHDEIGRRFRRSPGHIRRVEGLAHFKLALQLLGG